MSTLSKLSDEDFLDRLQHSAFSYFLLNVNSTNGLVMDTTRSGSPISIAVVGFALSIYPIAVERGWMLRSDAISLTRAALNFFLSSDQSGTPTATGYKGFYFHFLQPQNGTRMWQSELSMIDTALLIAGALVARQFFTADTDEEREIRAVAEQLYLRVDWRWSQSNFETIRLGWKPECGFLHYGWDGYSEAIILYALALGSPTQPLSDATYSAWTNTYQWENIYGRDVLYAGPLFIHQFSHAWINFRGMQDHFMREKNSDYFENTKRAAEIQREYAIRNPKGFAGYDKNCWGFTACDGPSSRTVDQNSKYKRLFGYAARGVPYGPDDGTLSACGPLATLPFAPEMSLQATRTMIEKYPEMFAENQLASSFNPSILGKNGRAWFSAGHFGLDQGIIVMMIENHRTQMIWSLMQNCAFLTNGLQKAGFRRGWLS
jgi:hypothetical protein